MAFECVIVKEEPNLKEDADNDVSSETASQNGADAEKNIIKVEIEVEAPAVRIKPEPLDPQPSTPPRSPSSDPSWHAPCQEGSTDPAAEEVTNILPEKYIQVSIKEEVDSDDITNASSTVEEHTIVEGPDVGQTFAEPIVVAIKNENAESMTYTSEALEPKRVDMDSGSKTQKKRKFRNEDGRQAIINSNLDFKKRQLEILEVEHSNKIKIQKLKIRKLQLEIALLEHTNAKI